MKTKKTLSTIVAAALALILAVLMSVGTVAANDAPDKGKAFDIYYGKAVVDGEKDNAYFSAPSVVSYVHNCTYEDKSFAYPDGRETSFECYLMWDETSLYGFIEVTDYTPVTYAFKDYKTDCLELNFILTDWASYAGKKTDMYTDIGNISVGMFRISNPVGANVTALYELLPMKGGLSAFDEIYGLSKCAVVKTDKGYNVEFSIKVPDDIVHLVCTPGAHIGFGIQCNDDVNDNGIRDSIIYSSNLDDQQGKTGEFVLLDKDGTRPDAPVSREPVVTSAPATEPVTTVPATSAPEVTTEPAVTTKAPASTTAEVTEAPATDAPAPATEAPADTKSGCGSRLPAASAAVMLFFVAGMALFCRKKA